MKKYTNFVTCHVRWCGARYFTINLTHVYKFYRDEICREGFEMWLLKVLLYHFDIVKMHCLD
jgi:hypothetical protein